MKMIEIHSRSLTPGKSLINSLSDVFCLIYLTGNIFRIIWKVINNFMLIKFIWKGLSRACSRPFCGVINGFFKFPKVLLQKLWQKNGPHSRIVKSFYILIRVNFYENTLISSISRIVLTIYILSFDFISYQGVIWTTDIFSEYGNSPL